MVKDIAAYDRKVGLEVLPPPILGLPYVPHDA